MQLIDTRVGTPTYGSVTVEFEGEGGELVSVRMNTDGNLDGDAAVLRAKEIMVQLTAFGGMVEQADEPENSGVSASAPSNPIVTPMG